MHPGCLRLIGIPAAIATAMAFSAQLAAGQAPGQDTVAASTRRAGNVTALRTPWGHPDLQGTWTNRTTTPLERGGVILSAQGPTPDQAAAVARASADPSTLSCTGAYNAFWLEAGSSSARASLLVDPPDGKLPALTPEAQKHADAIEAVRRRIPGSWMEMNAYDRCITRGLPGAMMPGFYNHNYEILQTPGYVAIVVEMIHDARIIPLDGRPHLSSAFKQWMGDSRGRWEGATLVVETTNFNKKIEEVSGNAMRLPTGVPSSDYRYHAVFGTEDTTLVERFTRVDANTIDYQFTVTAPKTFTVPWTAAAPMTKTEERLFEYACHEGNYAILNILSGARAREAREQRGDRR